MMELGNIVWFSSRQHPFVVLERHCLDLECECREAWLTLTEVDLSGSQLREPLSIEIHINLQVGMEVKRLGRAPHVEPLVREFLARFPEQQFQEMVQRRHEQRAIKQRLEGEDTLPCDINGELLCYSDLIFEAGGMARNGRRYSYFFAHEQREFCIEDHYCSNPTCDCGEVHVEFWQRTETADPHRVQINRHCMAVFTLDGELDTVKFFEEGHPATDRLIDDWRETCGYQLDEFRRRYRQVKSVVQRTVSNKAMPLKTARQLNSKALIGKGRVGRNDLCPCGSGRKFKRCCKPG